MPPTGPPNCPPSHRLPAVCGGSRHRQSLSLMAAIERLSWADLNNLAVEAPDTPMHQAVFATVDADALRDPEGRLRIADIRAGLVARIEHVPELRRVLCRPGLFGGRPFWIDDPGFRVEDHVLLATLPWPGGQAAAFSFAAHEMSSLMDRSMPLWRVWLLDGYSADRVGLLIKLHHALADGPAMVNMLAEILDLGPAALRVAAGPRAPARPRPTARELLQDSWTSKSSAVRRTLRTIAHPARSVQRLRSTTSAGLETIRNGRGTPRTSLNRPIGTSRRVAAFHLSLAEVKDVAHGHAATVNDVFLSLVAGGLRRVLISRGETVSGASIRASVAVSMHRSDHSMSGNHVGTVVVSLPADLEDAGELLTAVTSAMTRAKSRQLALVSTALMVTLARLGITRAYIRRQHMINVLTTNLPGPPVPLYFAGARVHDPVAMPPIAGNVTASFAALSYDGGLTLSVVADGAAWPDIDLLITSMRKCWLELRAQASAPARRAM